MGDGRDRWKLKINSKRRERIRVEAESLFDNVMVHGLVSSRLTFKGGEAVITCICLL